MNPNPKRRDGCVGRRALTLGVCDLPHPCDPLGRTPCHDLLAEVRLRLGRAEADKVLDAHSESEPRHCALVSHLYQDSLGSAGHGEHDCV